MTPRTWLFVPGDSPAKMEKALTAGADALILDLEDSVVEAQKARARNLVKAFLERRAPAGGPQLWVRINPLSTPGALLDLSTIVTGRLDGVVLPKAESPDEVLQLAEQLSVLEASAGVADGSIRLLPIVTETPISLFRLGGYAAPNPRLAGLTWGAEDLSAAVGALTARREDGGFTPLYDLARSLCLAAAAAADAAAIETVYPDFRDLDGLAAYAARGRRDGFVGMMAIHPSQIPVVNAAFTPTAAEFAHARRVVDLFAAASASGALSLDGRMLDAPHLRQARRLLERATKEMEADDQQGA